MYKRHLSIESVSSIPTSPLPWAKWQENQQEAWWEGDNCWCDYSEMEEIQNNHQSPSVWGSMQDLTSWSFMIMRTVRNQLRTTREDLGNDLKAVGTTVTKQTLVTHYTVKDWNPAAPARSPCSRKHMYRPVWSFPMIQRRTGWKCCGQMRPKSSSLASTRLVVFGGREMLTITPRTPSLQSSTEVETSCFGAVSLLRVQDDFTALSSQWMGPCTVKF